MARNYSFSGAKPCARSKSEHGIGAMVTFDYCPLEIGYGVVRARSRSVAHQRSRPYPALRRFSSRPLHAHRWRRPRGPRDGRHGRGLRRAVARGLGHGLDCDPVALIDDNPFAINAAEHANDLRPTRLTSRVVTSFVSPMRS